MPFVTRLAAAPTPTRSRSGARRTSSPPSSSRVLPPALEFSGLFSVAIACRSTGTVKETRATAAAAVDVIEKLVRVDQSLVAPVRRSLFADGRRAAGSSSLRIVGAEPAHDACRRSRLSRPTRFSTESAARKRASGAGSCFATAAAILGEALDIGKQADSIASETLLSRFETAKRVERASAAVNVFVPAEAT